MAHSQTRSGANSEMQKDDCSNGGGGALDWGVTGRLLHGQLDLQPLPRYPEQAQNAASAGDSMVAKTKSYCHEFVRAGRIDRHAMLPPGIIKGMGNLGVLGMAVDKKLGGTDMSTFNFCRVMEIIGGHCGSTAAMVRLQNCVVMKLLQNFGTAPQQGTWMSPIIAGEKSGALVITEELAGSDIRNLRTTAKENVSGGGFRLAGKKRWIANGADADVLIVLARRQDDHTPAGQVSAFLVPADRQGITINPTTANKFGLRGLSMASIELNDVVVSNEDVIGRHGEAVTMVETVATLDRISYAASTLGLMKSLLHAMVTRARTRTQFGQTIGHFKQVKQKIARVASEVYALEAAVYSVAAQYECDQCDGKALALDADVLKLFASESVWSAANDAMDLWGGKGLVNDQPLARVLRDVRHGRIGEGSNDLLKTSIVSRAFDQGHGNSAVAGAGKPAWWKTAREKFSHSPAIEVKHDYLRFHARWLAVQIGKLGAVCRSRSQSALDDSLRQARIADVAANLFVCHCVFLKLSALMVNGTVADPEKRFAFDTGALFLNTAKQKNVELFGQLKINLDQDQTEVADQWLDHAFEDVNWPAGGDEDPEAS